jgi:RNA polymerase sigma factor (sigma-70 family)
MPSLLSSLVRAVARESQLADAELLRRFVQTRDEAAFEILVWRHAALVYGACGLVLGRGQDAEDAFQATFLIFLRKCRSISDARKLAPWLYRVAVRTAMQARKRAAVRRQHEASARQRAHESLTHNFEIRPLLDEELGRLPEKYRMPLVLCYLEDMTKEEVAQKLRWPVGTVSSRLARGRERLRRRLLRRGVEEVAASEMAGFVIGQVVGPPPARLVPATVKALELLIQGQCGHALSANVLSLAKGSQGAVFAGYLHVMFGVACAVGLAGFGFSAWVPATGQKSQPADLQEIRRNEEPKKSADQPAPGTLRWQLKPSPAGFAGQFNSSTVLGIVTTDAGGTVTFTISYPARLQTGGGSKFQPVAICKDRRRILFKQAVTLHNTDLVCLQFRLDLKPISADEIDHIGLEELR